MQRDQQTLLPASTCVDALVAAEGNSALAAERLGVPTQVLIASIAQDPSAQASLNAQLRTLTTLMTFDTLRLSNAIVGEMMQGMEPADFAKFYTNLIQQTAALTDSHETTTNVNVTEIMLKMLPPEVRSAVLTLRGPDASTASHRDATGGTRNPLDDDDDAESAA